jgi:purine-nucleoside phosphorylase
MPQAQFTEAQYQVAADYVRQHTQHQPKIAIILGSGLGALANHLEQADYINYKEVPNMPYSQVHGHQNRFVVGLLSGVPVLMQQGRSHFYEGWTMAEANFPIRVMHLLGIETLIVSNAAGGMNKAFTPGDIMLITDHINFLGMAGQNPLMGPNDEAFGPRFPSMTRAYDLDLRTKVKSIAREMKITLRTGVYVGLSGPFFETPAEVRMLRILGADAVGMSTVNEVLLARHCGMRVIGFSAITNNTVDNDEEANEEPNHLEVLEIGKQMMPTLTSLVINVVQSLDKKVAEPA